VRYRDDIKIRERTFKEESRFIFVGYKAGERKNYLHPPLCSVMLFAIKNCHMHVTTYLSHSISLLWKKSLAIKESRATINKRNTVSIVEELSLCLTLSSLINPLIVLGKIETKTSLLLLKITHEGISLGCDTLLSSLTGGLGLGTAGVHLFTESTLTVLLGLGLVDLFMVKSELVDDSVLMMEGGEYRRRL
jgi:hypothetical protein